VSQPPVSPSAFHKIIEAAATVTTKNGLAALNLVLVFLAFLFVLFLLDGTDRLILTILIFVCWMSFAVFAVLVMRRDGDNKH
jgi:small-conductance mechanosensitive channel